MMENIKTIALGLMAVALATILIIEFTGDDGDGAATAAQAGSPSANTTPAIPNNAAQPANPDGDVNQPLAAMTFPNKSFDFGQITQGEKVTHTFEFTNTGANPLVISNAKGSCGCTVPQWPRNPIAPGEKGEIVVEFNSKNKNGVKTNTVTIEANTKPKQTQLTIKADVLVEG